MSAPYLGDYAAGGTVYFLWSTFSAAGASITRSGDGTIHVYKDVVGTTEVTTGITNVEDFDSLTGIHACTIELADAFYAAGHDYAVVLKASTVDGQTVNAVLAHFSIEHRSALRPTAAGRTLDVTATGAAGIDLANVENQGTTLTLSATTIKTATDVETDTADIQSRLPAALTAGGHIKADALAISGDTVAADNLEAAADGTTYNLGGGAIVAASVTGNVGGNVTGSVGSVAAGGITAASIATGAVDADALAADAVAEIADGVWDEARAGHVAAGSFGEGAASVQGNVTGSVASVTGAVGSVTGAVGSVTGAVGSVTGNVGGNVVGSVASVTGAVGSVTSPVTIATQQIVVKKHAALSNFVFPMWDSATPTALKSGLTVTTQRRIDAGSYAATANSATEIGTTGTYTIDFAAADLNGDRIAFLATATGAVPTLVTILTQP